MAEPDPRHPSTDRLRAFVLGEVPDDELERLAAHLNDCAACRTQADQFFAEAALLDQVRAAVQPGGIVQEDWSQRRQAARALWRRLRELQRPCEPGDAAAQGGGSPRGHPTPAEEDEPDDDGPGEPACPRQLGDYQVLGEVGRGGMGVVYRVWQRSRGRPAALKLVRLGALAPVRLRLRFNLEVHLAARVRHGNVVEVYEVGRHDGQSFLAMEWVAGGTLAERQGRPWPCTHAARLVRALAWGVHAAHAQGVIHRDLKPATILLGGPAGAEWAIPKIADFGLAWPLDWRCRHPTRRVAAGTPEYMAPELACGQPGSLGPAVDVYALGVILYELLTGCVPFQGHGSLAVLHAAAFTMPVPPRCRRPAICPQLEAITLRCLEKRPCRRQASAAELAGELDGYLARQKHHDDVARVRGSSRRPGGEATSAAGCKELVGRPRT
jgi:serine/threonine protein kinase